ncbi:hypothetical protein NHX12_019688 [Muraenolepis orangiensis]|uniref:Phosphoinositide phospholipase C n=1 Tax=Muraenolepis orangiensis TaxID=630683 RepID=A0A9Q0EU04_9TELE|nr:hypothetical protein NHX12_019688 [Muraenolepis orangiensis]
MLTKKRYTLEPPQVKDYLVKGERFTKWSEDSTKTSPVTMKMDSKGYYLYWINQSKDTTFLDVAHIRDTRVGKYAKLPKHPKVRNVFNMDFPDSNYLSKTLTIVTGMDMVNLTYYNFFAGKEKVSPNWATDVLAVAYNAARNNSCRQIFLDKIFVRISIQTNKDGKIPVKNVYKMFPADKKRVESSLAAARLPKGKYDTMKPDVFTESAFKTFLMHLCPRPEIFEIFSTYTPKPFMTKDIFTKFLNEKQRDPRLNEELFPRLRQDQIKALIDKYEPATSNSSKGQITPEGLMFYLMGSETSIVILDRLATCNDMTQPIPHYFIKSSHNTYLTAGQFSGVSTPEMYRQCLLSGCRCLELDCWKGKPPDEEPYITHGFTMTTEIFFKYPVVLSFENHVDSVKQQEKMANYCKTIFGDSLLTEPLEKYPLKPGQQIPSPSELMGKILIKNKKGSHDKPAPAAVEAAPEATAAPEAGDGAQDPASATPAAAPEGQADGKAAAGTAGQEVTAYEAMSSIVNYIQPNKFVSFENSRKKNKSYGISSFVETKGEAMIAKSAVEFVEYNRRQMSRIYPKGTRMDSSNYNPQTFWNAGCQFVALNYQTMDFPMQLNMALFEYNGRSGYLLKHDVMRRSDKKFDPYCERIDTIVANTLTLKIYSGQFLSDKSVKTGVEVEILGLPNDPKKKFRTKWTATPNAINPILLPEMASLRLVVHEENGKFLAHRILPLDAIQSGFQHICLRSESNMVLTLPALFVYIEIKDYIPAAFADFTDALFNPTKGTEKTTKPQESSADYVSPYEMPAVAVVPVVTPAPAAEPKAAEEEPKAAEEEPKAAEEEPKAAEEEPKAAEEEPKAAEEEPKAAEEEPKAAEEEPKAAEEPKVEEEPKAPEEEAKATEDAGATAEATPAEPASEPSGEPDPGAEPAVVPVPVAVPSEKAAATDSTPTPSGGDPATVTCDELIQHKNYIKVTKRQEKEIKDLEKKFQKKEDDLIQKYTDTFKAFKKKTSVKKKEGEGDAPEAEAKEQKEKLQGDLNTLWVEQCNQLKKKKDQHATERLAKLLEMATEKHTSEIKTLESDKKEGKKTSKKLKKAASVEMLDEASDGADTNQQQEALTKKQAATMEEIKALANQLNKDALEEREQRMRSLPVEVKKAANGCVADHFPKLVDESEDKTPEGDVYGDLACGTERHAVPGSRSESSPMKKRRDLALREVGVATWIQGTTLEEDSDEEDSDEEDSDEEGSDEEDSDEEGSDEEGSDEEGSDEEDSDEEDSDEEDSDEEGSDEEGSDEEDSDEEDSDEEGSDEEDSDEEDSDEEGSDEEDSDEEGSDEEGSDEEDSDEEDSDEEGSDEEGSDEEDSDEEGSDEEGSDEEGSDEEGSDEEDSDEEDSDEESSDEEDSDEEGSDEEGSDEEDSDEEGSDEEDSDEEGSDEEDSDEEDSDEEGSDEEDSDEEDSDEEGSDEEDSDEEGSDEEDSDEEDSDEEGSDEEDSDEEDSDEEGSDEEDSDEEDSDETVLVLLLRPQPLWYGKHVLC